MLSEIPDENLTPDHVQQALRHLGYRVVYDMPGTYLMSRDGQRVVPLFKGLWPLKRSYIEEEVLANFGISKAEFLSALNAVSSAQPSGQS